MASGDTLLVFTPLDSEPPSSNYAQLDTRNGHPVLDFDGVTDEETIFSGLLPRHYGGGGITVTLHVAFSLATSGTSRWQVSIERMSPTSLDLDLDSFATAQSNGVTAPGTSGHIVLCAIPFTAGAQMDSWTSGEPGRINVRRDADETSGTDDITSDAELVMVEITET
jgi:hypothetical protein